VDLTGGLGERLEEAEPLDMVHVEMCQQEVDASYTAPHRRPQPLNPGSRVQDQEAVPVAPHLDTGRVAPVANRLRPRGGK